MVRIAPPSSVCRSLEKPGTPAKFWYPPAPSPVGEAPGHNRRRLILLVFAVGIIILWWGYSRFVSARQTNLFLIGSTYPDNPAIPPNPYTWNGLQDLAQLTRSDSASKPTNLRLLQEPQEVHRLTDWDKDLHRASGGTVVLFFGFHGSADRQGAFFLGPQAKLSETEQTGDDCLRFEAVLERLKQLPSSQNIVLLLDDTQIHQCLVHHDFVWALDKLNPAIGDMPNLIVVNASDVGQRSWLAEDRKRSIFAHFVTEGMKGSADREPHDGRITALELVEYVSGEVRQWARTRRDAEQTPALWPRGHIGRDRASKIILARLQN